jgi:hypothetical protein
MSFFRHPFLRTAGRLRGYATATASAGGGSAGPSASRRTRLVTPLVVLGVAAGSFVTLRHQAQEAERQAAAITAVGLGSLVAFLFIAEAYA